MMAAAITLAAAAAGCGEDDNQPPAPPIATVVQDDAELLHRSPKRIAATLDDLRDLGVSWVRVTAGWSVIAPEPRSVSRPDFDARDPGAYPPGAWSKLDRLQAMARARGLRLAIDIAFWAPRWAVSKPARLPDHERDTIADDDYANFAEAVARRYPRSVAFTVWNEPNHNAFLLPQWQRSSNGWRPASPHLYRTMIEAAVPRIKAAAPDALALIGATSSVGSEQGNGPSERMAPLTFLRALACVDEALAPLDVPECETFAPLPGDGWSHHPYSLELAPWQTDPRPDNVRMGDLGRLTSLLARLHAEKRTREDLPLYLTESGYQTSPPDPTWDVSLADQARWLPEAERIARRQPSLRSMAQFLYRDLPERPGGDLNTRWRDYQSGLRFIDGRPKPAHAAFVLPLVAERVPGGKVAFWGLVRRGSGAREVRVSVLEPDGDWREILSTHAMPDGTFKASAAVDPSRTFRLQSGGRVGSPLKGAR